MPITPDQAWDATDPSQSDEARKMSAAAIMAGVAANDSYIASRDQLEQVMLRYQGGQVVRHSDVNALDKGQSVEEVTGGGVPTTESGTLIVPAGGGVTSPSDSSRVLAEGGTGDVDAEGTATDVDNEAIEKLRKQLEDAGITPEA